MSKGDVVDKSATCVNGISRLWKHYFNNDKLRPGLSWSVSLAYLSYRDHKTVKSGAEGALQVSTTWYKFPGYTVEIFCSNEFRFDGETSKFWTVVSLRTCC